MRTAIIIAALAVLAGCSSAKDAKENMAEMKQPVNCATAQGDLRALASEKKHVGSEIAAGVGAIVPIGLVVNLVAGTEGTELKITTGEYDRLLDKRIAEIKQTCNL